MVYPRGQYWFQYCFYTVINDLENGAECTLIESVCDTKLRAVADTPESPAAIQKDLKRLEK